MGRKKKIVECSTEEETSVIEDTSSVTVFCKKMRCDSLNCKYNYTAAPWGVYIKIFTPEADRSGNCKNYCQIESEVITS